MTQFVWSRNLVLILSLGLAACAAAPGPSEELEDGVDSGSSAPRSPSPASSGKGGSAGLAGSVVGSGGASGGFGGVTAAGGQGGTSSSMGGRLGTGGTLGGGGAAAMTGNPDGALRPATDGGAVPLPAGDAGLAAGTALERVFNLDKIHEVSLTVDPKDLARLDKVRDSNVTAALTFDGQSFPKVGLSKKGAYGFDIPITAKPSFSVAIDFFDPKARLFGLDKLVLNSGRQDKGFVNEHLAYDLFRRMKLPASFTSHAVLKFNGKIYGFYVIKEAEDGDFFKRNFGKDNDRGNFYQAPCNPDSPVQCPDFVTGAQYMELRHEKTEMRKRDDINAAAALVRSTPAGSGWEAIINTKIDMENFLFGMAIDALVGHWDDYQFSLNNYNMYDNPKDGRFVFIPHGMDSTFETDGLAGFTPAKVDPNSKVNGLLAKPVRSIPEMETKYRAALQRILKEAWDIPSLSARIDQVTKVLTAYPNQQDARIQSDMKRHTEGAASVKAFLKRRKDQFLK